MDKYRRSNPYHFTISSVFSTSFHSSTWVSSIFFISFHYSTYFSSVFSLSFHYFLLYFPNLFTILWKICEKSKLKCEMIWKLWKKISWITCFYSIFFISYHYSTCLSSAFSIAMWNDMEIMEENKLNSDKIWTNIEEVKVIVNCYRQF
jgi:hypothetical protein